MQILDRKQSIDWLVAKGLSVSENNPSFSQFYKVMDTRIPGDSGRKSAISRALVSQFDANGESLLWINEFGIWPSSEERNLFDGFRRSLGERRALHEAPGHLFSKSDLANVTSLLAMALYFIWGAVLYSPEKGLAIEIDHDEFIRIFTKNKNDSGTLAAVLKDYFTAK